MIDEGQGLPVEPMQVFQQENQGLLPALPGEQRLECRKRAAATLWRTESVPAGISGREIQQ